MEWSESDLAAWMNAVNITAYLRHFQAGGVVRGCDLQGLDDAGLFELGITDELHRQIIMECLDELRNGTSSRVSGESYAKPLVSYHASFFSRHVSLIPCHSPSCRTTLFTSQRVSLCHATPLSCHASFLSY